MQNQKEIKAYKDALIKRFKLNQKKANEDRFKIPPPTAKVFIELIKEQCCIKAKAYKKGEVSDYKLNKAEFLTLYCMAKAQPSDELLPTMIDSNYVSLSIGVSGELEYWVTEKGSVKL